MFTGDGLDGDLLVLAILGTKLLVVVGSPNDVRRLLAIIGAAMVDEQHLQQDGVLLKDVVLFDVHIVGTVDIAVDLFGVCMVHLYLSA